MDNIKEKATRERRYEKLMKPALEIIEKNGLEPVFGTIMSLIMDENLKNGYTNHVSFKIGELADELNTDIPTVCHQLDELGQFQWVSAGDTDVWLSWGEFELSGNIATVVLDYKFLEIFMRVIALDTLNKELKEKTNV